MPKKAKKHEILGGIKVSSQQLSEWGSLGGRPKQHSSNAERQRAYKLRKKQDKFGEKAELRGYKSYGEIQVKKVNCLHSFSFLRGEIKVKEVRKINKRAGNSGERVKRFREKKPPTGSLKVV